MKARGRAGEALHAGLVAEDRAARAGRRGIDGEDGEPAAGAGQHQAEALDEARLADAGGAGQADAQRRARRLGQRGEEAPRARRGGRGGSNSTRVMARASARRSPAAMRPASASVPSSRKLHRLRALPRPPVWHTRAACPALFRRWPPCSASPASSRSDRSSPCRRWPPPSRRASASRSPGIKVGAMTMVVGAVGIALHAPRARSTPRGSRGCSTSSSTAPRPAASTGRHGGAGEVRRHLEVAAGAARDQHRLARRACRSASRWCRRASRRPTRRSRAARSTRSRPGSGCSGRRRPTRSAPRRSTSSTARGDRG